MSSCNKNLTVAGAGARAGAGVGAGAGPGDWGGSLMVESLGVSISLKEAGMRSQVLILPTPHVYI